MKIAMVTPYNVKCGIFTYSRDLYTALAKQDVETYIIRFPRFGIKSHGLMENVARKIPKDVDLIHVQHEYGLFEGYEGLFYNILKENKKPIVTTMHAVGNFNADKTTSVSSNKVIVHNDFCQRKYSGESTIIHHGCTPVDPMPVEAAKKIMGIPSKLPIIGYIGFISQHKGIDDIILAVEPIETAGVVIGGGWHRGPDTEYMNELKELGNQRLGGRIQWTGFVETNRLATVYGCMDIVVVPSRFATESGALLTAMAHGKPIIARNLPPFKEKNLMTFDHAPELSAKISEVIDNNLLEKMGGESMEYAKANSWDKIAAQHKKLYKSLA